MYFCKKNSGLRTIELAFGISFFSPKQIGTLFSSIFPLAFAFFIFRLFTHSIYINKNYTQEGWRNVHQLG
jgi:hypothetical protein